jgi:putative transposase
MADWPHAPVHRIDEQGTYMVTGATYYKRPHFRGENRLDFLTDALLEMAERYGWRLQAWAVFPNHYHFVAISPEDPSSLRTFVTQLHSQTATRLNQLDGTKGRRVWFQYYDSQITYQKSYLARLKYVHHNAVKHGCAEEATRYRWCSAGWFETHASPAFQRTVASFKTDALNIVDDFGDAGWDGVRK